MPLLLNYRDLKKALKPLPGYFKLREVVDARVDALASRPTASELADESKGIAAIADLYENYRAVKRTAVKATVWHHVAMVLSGQADDSSADLLPITLVAQTMAETSTASIQAGVDALEAMSNKVAESLPAINEEAF